ncbi:MAG TPA: VanZ family protein [Burkholderiales bacterium]|nr:VanZ family protein [Burkholderiales bacterium]
MAPRASPLARYLLAAYLLLVVYGSLYPLAGWRDQGLSPFAFLEGPLPRYFTWFDVAANVAAYAPLGLLAVLAMAPRVAGAAAALLGTAGAVVISVLLEGAQSYLPDRIPSNADLAANAVGAALGALTGVAVSRHLAADAGLHRLRERVFGAGHAVDLGLVLMGLWIFTQLNPETLLFGNGALRDLLGGETPDLYPAETFVRIEAAVAAANVVAVALLVAALVAAGGPRRRVAAATILAALAARTLAFAILFEPQAAFAWLTPGAATGLAVGAVAALLLAGLPETATVALCGVALMSGTVLVNLAPENPYLAHSLAVWWQGHFLNFNGLTRTVSTLWPFAALAYLLVVATRARSAR